MQKDFQGCVSLVGAGPGDLELLTLKGRRCLEGADVVVYDRLVNPALLDYVPRSCRRIFVGKEVGQKTISQEEIEGILIQEAKAGKKVVRLKSGDPYIFGRGGEEAMRLKAEGIAFEVIPGLTSAMAGLTYAGIPMTYRDRATSFHVFTAHLQDEEQALNWEAIAALKGTLVFLMGLGRLETIVGELVARNYPLSTPVAVIEWATHPQQRSLIGTLETILALVKEAHYQTPCLIVVGDVVNFSQDLNTYESLPLKGQSILIQEGASRLSELLRSYGAQVRSFPRRKNMKKLPSFVSDSSSEILAFADVGSWQLFVEDLRQEARDIRSLAENKIWALGHLVQSFMEERGLYPDSQSPYLCDPQLVKNKDYQIYCSLDQQKELADYYGQERLCVTHGWEVAPMDEDDYFPGSSAVCLQNSRAARDFIGLATAHCNIPVFVMGQRTRTLMEEAGYKNIVSSERPDFQSLVEALFVYSEEGSAK